MSRRRFSLVMGDSQPTYMDLLLKGKVLQEDIDDFVARWHDAPEGSEAASRSLVEFLGMTWDEYRLWVERPESLRFIAAAHRANQSVETVLEASAGVAARADDQSEARKLLRWLIERGRVKEQPRH